MHEHQTRAEADKKRGELDRLIETAELYHRAGRLEDAEHLYREILSQEPENSQATHLLGLIAMQVGKFEISQELFQTALELDPSNPVFHCNLATLSFLQGDLKKAEQGARKALELDPDYVDAKANLGKILKEQGRTEEAKECLRQAVNSGARDADTITSLAETHLHLGNFTRAEELTSRLLKRDPEALCAYPVLIESLLAQDRAVEAIPLAEEFKSKSPEDSRSSELLNKVYEKAGFTS